MFINHHNIYKHQHSWVIEKKNIYNMKLIYLKDLNTLAIKVYHHDIYKHQNSWIIEKKNSIQCETYFS